jgi:hypothetical protein
MNDRELEMLRKWLTWLNADFDIGAAFIDDLNANQVETLNGIATEIAVTLNEHTPKPPKPSKRKAKPHATPLPDVIWAVSKH